LDNFEDALKYYEDALAMYNSLGMEKEAEGIRQSIEMIKNPKKYELSNEEIEQLLAAINAQDG
jgi:hypothetical protein